MYYFHYPYPHDPSPPFYPGYYVNYPIHRQYPPVDPKIFKQSVKSYRLLMAQGSILLDRLDDEGFEIQIMKAAQQGQKAEVDKLINSIGLNVPVTTNYTPSGITFELSSQAEHDHTNPFSCCTLTVHMKWGR